ncbi:tRNA (adenosine(37)-N6)-threonylcarbamoyltransferase complex transferase subunit TsaD, partial [Candidatus Parcubacteria bacterium]
EAEKELSDDFKKRVACEFEDAVTEVLVEKTLRAADEYGVKTIVVGGGVSANTHIKATLREQTEHAGIALLISPLEFATDNAVMIALAGYFHALKKEFCDVKTLRPDGQLKLSKKT